MLPDPEPAPRRVAKAAQVRWRAACWAGGLIAVLVLATVLTVDPQSAHLLGAEGPLCWLGAWSGGTLCPGCGLTRSTALAAQGQLATSWAVHPGGLATVVVCGLGVLVQLDVLRRGVRPPLHRAFGTWAPRALLTAIVLGFAAQAAGAHLPNGEAGPTPPQPATMNQGENCG